MTRSTSLQDEAEEYLSVFTERAPAEVKAHVQANPALRSVQAEHAALCARKLRLRRGALFVLNNPVGTGKTPVALAAARLLLHHVAQPVRRVIVIAPNKDVADKWRAGARHMTLTASDQPAGDIVVLTASQIGRRPLSSNAVDRLVIVDEAHRGLHSDTRRRQGIAQVARGARVLLVTATPFQLTGAGLESFLSIAGSLTPPQRRHMEQLSKGMVDYLTAMHHAEKEADSDQQLIWEASVAEKRDALTAIANRARPTLNALFMPPFPTQAVYGAARDALARAPLPASPNWIELDQWALAYHAARVLPVIWPADQRGDAGVQESAGHIRNSDSCMRMLASSYSAWKGHAAVRNATRRDPEHVEPLVAAVTAGTHPKVAATRDLAVEALLDGSHVLIFCVYRETQTELQTVIQAAVHAHSRLGGHRVAAPTTHQQAKRCLEDYFGSQQKPSGVMIVRDNLSEAIDLDGGQPVVIHHDLFWSPVRWEQRMGRVVRASTGFQPAKAVKVPLLRTDNELRMWETLHRRLQLSVGVISGLIPDHETLEPAEAEQG